MDKLAKLISLCKCGVYLTVNEHRDYYETPLQFLSSDRFTDDIDADIKQKIVETNTIVELTFYPRTPISFYTIVHYDLESALDLALETFNENT